MTCYMISQGGEPVALVANLDLARAITQCQPWGEYLVESLEVGEPIAARSRRARPRSAEVEPADRDRRSRRRTARWSRGMGGVPAGPAPPPAP